MIDRSGFILANTRLMAPPLVPEIRLHLAEESLPIWRKTEEELGEMGLPPPYWAFAWAGGQALARYVLDHGEEIQGRTVIDIGAGSGLSAIAAAMVGARRVDASDIDAIAVAAIGTQRGRQRCIGRGHHRRLACRSAAARRYRARRRSLL